MQTVSKLFFSLIAAALFLSVSTLSAQACEGGIKMSIAQPQSQSVAETTPVPPTKPANDG